MSYVRFAEKDSKKPGLIGKTAPSPVSGSLRIGETGDAFEQEADRAADAVMGDKARLHWSLSKIRIGAAVQRKCTCASVGSHESRCGGCEQQPLQRRAVGLTEQAAAPPIVHEVLDSPGQPLDEKIRAYFEPRFGEDFSNVRVHTGARAAESARAVHALAYTAGNNIVFGRSQYAPGSASGRNLLAHELTHTIQQSAGGGSPYLQRQVDVDESNDQEEVNEPHDGDTPVDTSPATSTAEEDLGTVRDPDLGTLAQNDPEEMQAGGEKKKKEKKKPDPPKKITSIDVDLSTQTMTVHYSDGTTEGHPIASGKGKPGTTDDPCKTQTEENCTPTGDFKIVSKGNENTKNKHGDKMAWYVELGGDKVIDNRGIGIHDSQPVGGGPRSHGCVRVGDSEKDKDFAKRINKGVDDTTVIHITGKAATKPWGKKPAPKKAPKSEPKKKEK